MYLTIVRTAWNPEDEYNGHLRVSRDELPRVKLLKGGAKRNEQIKRSTYEKFVANELIDGRGFPLEYQEAIVDWLMVAGPADNLLLPSIKGVDAALLVLTEDEPVNFAVRETPAYKLINEDDEAADELDDEEDDEDEESDDEEEDPGENRTYLEDEDEDDEPRPRKPPRKLPPKKKPR